MRDTAAAPAPTVTTVGRPLCSTVAWPSVAMLCALAEIALVAVVGRRLVGERAADGGSVAHDMRAIGARFENAPLVGGPAGSTTRRRSEKSGSSTPRRGGDIA